MRLEDVPPKETRLVGFPSCLAFVDANSSLDQGSPSFTSFLFGLVRSHDSSLAGDVNVETDVGEVRGNDGTKHDGRCKIRNQVKEQTCNYVKIAIEALKAL